MALVLLEQRHSVGDLCEPVDIGVSAGGAQRTHHGDDELGEPADVDGAVLRLLLDQGQVQDLLDVGAQAAVAWQQEGQESLGGGKLEIKRVLL